MEYFQNTRDAVARLRWQPPGGSPTLAWASEAAETVDYYVFYGPKIDNVIAAYRQATGQAPLPPKWALGYWQSKERYNTQQEWLDIAAEYRTRRLPIDNWCRTGTTGTRTRGGHTSSTQSATRTRPQASQPCTTSTICT